MPPNLPVRKEHLLELCKNAEETARIARDACLRAIQNGVDSATIGEGLRPESMRVIQAHAALEGSLETLRQAAGYLRSPKSGIYAQVTTRPPPYEPEK